MFLVVLAMCEAKYYYVLTELREGLFTFELWLLNVCISKCICGCTYVYT